MDNDSKDKQLTPVEPMTVDLGTFINLLNEWHDNKVAYLRHMSQIPEGITVTINDKTHELVGEFREGFTLGMLVALSELGSCPISKGVISELPEETPIPSPGEVNATIH